MVAQRQPQESAPACRASKSIYGKMGRGSAGIDEMNWTIDQYRTYMQKTMREQPRARETIRVQATYNAKELRDALANSESAAEAAGWPVKKMKRLIAKATITADQSRHIVEKVKRTHQRNGYNILVVLAWFKECGIWEPNVEYQFDPQRLWRWDFCWIDSVKSVYLALECNGGLWIGGAHVRPGRMLNEFEKWNRGAVLGYRIMFCTPQNLCTKDLADQIREALAI